MGLALGEQCELTAVNDDDGAASHFNTLIGSETQDLDPAVTVDDAEGTETAHGEEPNASRDDRRPARRVGTKYNITGGWDRGIGRRKFLAMSGMGAVTFVLGAGEPTKGTVFRKPTFADYPFKLGVASGDPLPDGVVLWTRLAPDPLNGGGMPRRDVKVRWEVASDEGFAEVVQKGKATATPEFAHSVHIEVEGLRPGRHYWYRFKAGDEISPAGRTKTSPKPGAPLGSMAFAFASCQNWEEGYYPAYRAMAEEELDLVLHLGDYIYEWGPMGDGPRTHETPAPATLDGYRDRYALYKTDPDLQAAHAAHPWVVTWDDHEGHNNYVDLLDRKDRPTTKALLDREASYQAYYEHMPLRSRALPRGTDMRLFRRITYGDLAEFSVLDTRQYRTEVPCGYGLGARCNAALNKAATMTGPRQERWLLRGLGSSGARWNAIAQQVMMTEYDYNPHEGERFNNESWDGYVAARDRILSYLSERRPSNPVVITGDMHSSWVADLKADFRDESSATVGTELVGTSITSGLSDYYVKRYEKARDENPHVRYFDARTGGYVRCDLTPEEWRSDLRLADSVLDPLSPVRTVASFVVEDGHPGAIGA